MPSTGPAAQTPCPEPSSGGNERPFSSSRGSGAFGFSCKHFSVLGKREAVSQGWEQPLVVSGPLAASSRRLLGPGGRSPAANQLLPTCEVSCVPKAPLRSCLLKQKSTAVLFPSRGQVWCRTAVLFVGSAAPSGCPASESSRVPTVPHGAASPHCTKQLRQVPGSRFPTRLLKRLLQRLPTRQGSVSELSCPAFARWCMRDVNSAPGAAGSARSP